MRSILKSAVPDTCAATRVVCLPGAYHTPEDFLTAGFQQAVRQRGLAVDLLLLDAELAHLGDRRFSKQLEDTVLRPARAAGTRSVWLTGISLGGFMALDYVATHPGHVEGVCLLAPYLGNRMLLGEITKAKTLADWVPGELADSDEERRVWRFLQTHRQGPPRLYLGYGRDDRFAQAHRLLAAALDAAAVDVVPGGHDWGTWQLLWENFLDSGAL